ncbi:YbaN family protein [Ramlibacter tataouinensis]|uniref:YbaN family protein n=1 Tax=Ramlibacter tataouinensis TaxID=94132 RepID=UPI0022F3B667|nr:YbaN family protein [Ramlibacter tataouinensis]WBY01975.1 YbaN family protein [Ramlibacter tataouinensis]
MAEPSAEARPAPPRPLRWFYLALALASLALGIVGIFLPVLPTVPFILLSAWAAARSSPRLLRWLENHRHFGRVISDWRRGGVVARKAKWLATVLMAASVATMLVVVGPRWYILTVVAIIASVLAWLWQRPETFPDA